MCRSKKRVHNVKYQEKSGGEETLFVAAVTTEVQNDEWLVMSTMNRTATRL